MDMKVKKNFGSMIFTKQKLIWTYKQYIWNTGL